MSRKAEFAVQNQMGRNITRRGNAVLIEGTANILESLIETNFKAIMQDHHDYQDQEEYLALKKARRYMRWSLKALRVVARRMSES